MLINCRTFYKTMRQHFVAPRTAQVNLKRLLPATQKKLYAQRRTYTIEAVLAPAIHVETGKINSRTLDFEDELFSNYHLQYV
jgi:hypothetical protein